MKSGYQNKLLTSVSIALLVSILFLSCRKSDRDKDTSTTMVESYLFAELVFNDLINTAYQIIHSENNLYKLQSNVLPSCATLNIDTAALPYKITINYGTSTCADANGYNKKGTVIVYLYGKFKTSNSKTVFNFNGYQFQDFIVTGDITLTNLGLNAANKRKLNCTIKNGSIKNNTESYYYNCNKTYIYTQGDTTKNYTDDIWAISGTINGLGKNGEPFDVNIDSVLTGTPICNYPTQGKATLNPGGKLSNRKIDFGNGDCDKAVSVTFNGKTQTITLK
jgi:hypothetical protein